MDEQYYKLKYYKYRAKYHKLLEQAQQGGSALNNPDIYARARQSEIDEFAKYEQPPQQLKLVNPNPVYYSQPKPKPQLTVEQINEINRETNELDELHKNSVQIMQKNNSDFMGSNPYGLANSLEVKSRQLTLKVNQLPPNDSILPYKNLLTQVSNLVSAIRAKADGINSPHNSNSPYGNNF